MHKLMDFIYSKQINTNGLVLRGWYTSLTLAVYGTAERPHGHDQSSPPPPPPPPPQQPSGPKRIIKQGGHLLKKNNNNGNNNNNETLNVTPRS